MERPLIGPCHNCFAPDSAYFPHSDTYMCAKHAALVETWDSSRQHFLELLEAPMQVWADHWLARGLTEQDARAMFECLEDDLNRVFDDATAEKPKAETA